MRRVPRGAGAAAVALGAVLVVACNLVLGIEEQPTRPTDEAGAPDVDRAEGAVPGAAPSRCSVDADCVPPNGCYRAKCDTVVGACSYALCPSSRACAMGVCDAKTFTCTSDTDYGFRTTSYGVPDIVLGCDANPQACVAASFPYLFVGTTTGTVALLVDDLRATVPTAIPIPSIAFRPAQVVASGKRIWILGAVGGGTPPYELPIAWIDVPSDPTTRTLTASSTLLSYPFPTALGLPAPEGALFLANDDPGQGFPVATLTPPLPATPILGVGNQPGPGPTVPNVPMARLASPPLGSAIAGSSGSRLVLYRPSLVNLVTDPGAGALALGPDQPITPAFPALTPPHFAEGPDGVVMLSGPIAADVDCNCTTHERFQWLLPNAVSTMVDPNLVIDIEGFANAGAPSPPALCHSCAEGYFAQPSLATWIDARTVLVASPASDPNRSLTEVSVLTRDPLTAPPTRRAKTQATDVPSGNFATDRVALSSANGFGYLVLADSQSNHVTVSIFDPRCDVPAK